MLKAKISQTKSNLYAVKTTKYDTTDIELTVETTDSSPWLNPKFELLGIKSDGHEVRQTENFKVVDLNNHIVQVTLDEQFVTCDGNVDLQLLIKDGSRKSSTPFKLYVGRSLDSDILESHRNVKVLDELEKYIIEGREYISEATKLAQSTANYVQAVNTQAEVNEAQRLQNESQRQSAETKRKEAEDDRKQAEVLRVQNEDTRQSAEVIRIANEQTRLENESNRIERETARENKESIRQTHEQQRHNAESTRQSQEATRQSNEDNRKQAEKSRNQEETTRINNEATRKQAEDARQSQELDRQSAESARGTAETNRNNAESTRTQNENTRQSQETSRVTNEQARVQQEQARVNNENTRKTEEAKRVEAEELRKEAYTEATQLLEELRNFEPITENDRTDYMGNQHESLKAKNDADVDWLLGEINTVHYDGQHITATDTIEGRSKSAILSGNTLVNLVKSIDFVAIQYGTCTDVDRTHKLIENADGNGASIVTEFKTIYPLSPSTTYYLKLTDNMVTNSLLVRDHTNLTNLTTVLLDSENKIIKFTTTNLGTSVLHFYQQQLQVGAKVKYIENIIVSDNLDSLYKANDYFEGMQSVKMPVLTTTGKNLFNMNDIVKTDFELDKYQTAYYGKEFMLQPNTTYIIKPYLREEITDTSVWVVFNIINKTSRLEVININKTGTSSSNALRTQMFTTDSTGKIGYSVYCHNHTEVSWLGNLPFDIQLEKGSTTTSYEPYKSNILTTPEDLELRGIGDVKDELNVATGELTQRVGGFNVSSIKKWNVGTELENTIQFVNAGFSALNNASPRTDCLGDIIPYGSGLIGTDDKEQFFVGNDLSVRILKSKLNGVLTPEKFIEWLSSVDFNITYQLATESIKTVDLSDNHVYSYKGTTHYDCSSAEGSLVPTLSIDVPTNLPAVVTRQRETIREQEDQIKLLEETNSELIISQETQDEEIVTNMLASVELFEMVLSMTPLSIDMSKSMEVNPMVEVYVTLILKGEKTIEQVPAVIRDKVQAQLDLLTK